MLRIIIDPGHGGREDPGAVGNGLIEKDLTMFLAVRTEERLDNYDCEAEIFQDPNADALSDLSGPVEYANKVKADLFVSLHINSVEDLTATGFESYRMERTAVINEILQKAIHQPVAEYCIKNGIVDRGMKTKNLYVLRETDMPAVLLECGFLSSPVDAKRLKNIRFLDGLANEIAWGIVQALGLKLRQEGNGGKVQKLEDENRRLRQLINDVHWKTAIL